MTVAIDNDAPALRVDDSGTIRIGQSRVTLDIVIWAYLHDNSPEEIVRNYPTLALPAYGAIAYYLRHCDVLGPNLEQRQRKADELKQQIQSRPGYQELTDRVLSRAQARGLR